MAGKIEYPFFTRSGLSFDLARFSQEHVVFADVAYGLSNLARWCGQCDFYSVAQHCVLAHDLLEKAHPPGMGIHGLLHDAHEAYLTDIPRPLKEVLGLADEPVYEDLVERIDDAIYTRSGFKRPGEAIRVLVKEVDLALLFAEARDIMPWSLAQEKWLQPKLDKAKGVARIVPWTREAARKEYLLRLAQYGISA